MRFSGLTSAVLLSLSLLSFAAPTAKVITNEEIKTKSAQGLRLLRLSDDAAPEWHTQDELMDLIRADIGFFDVTEFYDESDAVSLRKGVTTAAVSYDAPSYQAEVMEIIETLREENLETYLNELSSFNNRFYQSATGEEATQWIVSTISDIITSSSASTTATVRRYAHSWRQGSIIASFLGSDPSLPIVVLGAHMDSINSRNPTTGRAPGMDDDGSGSVNLIEAFRALVNSGFAPKATVEFQWYSGEEVGLLGSQAISRDYQNQGVQVKGMLQLDMTAYFRPGSRETISLIPDHVSSDLTSYVGELVDAYCAIPYDISSPCGYGCSDHASWDSAGYPSAFPFETRFGEHNSNIHTSNDVSTINGFSYKHSLEFSKLAVGFAYELGMME